MKIELRDIFDSVLFNEGVGEQGGKRYRVIIPYAGYEHTSAEMEYRGAKKPLPVDGLIFSVPNHKNCWFEVWGDFNDYTGKPNDLDDIRDYLSRMRKSVYRTPKGAKGSWAACSYYWRELNGEGI